MSVLTDWLSPALQKLTLQAFTDDSYTVLIKYDGMDIDAAGLRLPFNPEQIAFSYSTPFEVRQPFSQGAGSKQRSYVFTGGGGVPRSLSFTFYLDATLPENDGYDIAGTLRTLEVFAYSLSEESGETAFLKMTWGKETFHGRMTGMTAMRTLFDHDGTPLQATVTLTLLEQRALAHFKAGGFVPPAVNLTIPVMPVLTTLLALVALGAAVAGEMLDYVQTAADNDMDSLYDLVPGSTLSSANESENW